MTVSLPETEHPDATMRYGAIGTQVADVFEPPAATDSLVLLPHGGFWLDSDRMRTWAAGHALAAAGHLTVTVAYRSGVGSWTAALDDIATAIEQIQLSGREWTIHNEAPRTITLVGHSSGGQLALWAASRASLPSGSRWRAGSRLVTGAVAVAPLADLRRAAELGLGDGAVRDFLGGAPEDVPDAYAVADPSALTPAVPVHVLHGADDEVVPAELSERYGTHLRESGATGWEVEILDSAPHRSWGDPTSPAWPVLLRAVDRVAGREPVLPA
jgi:acetyl esterase/lipase